MKELDNIIESFKEFSKATETISEINRLRKHNSELKSVCGSCAHWMTPKCPIETVRHKVSNEHPICNNFKIEKWVSDLIAKNENKINNLRNKLTSQPHDTNPTTD